MHEYIHILTMVSEGVLGIIGKGLFDMNMKSLTASRKYS